MAKPLCIRCGRIAARCKYRTCKRCFSSHRGEAAALWRADYAARERLRQERNADREFITQRITQADALVPHVGTGPTRSEPGSVERLAVYIARYAAGMRVFNHQDARSSLQ